MDWKNRTRPTPTVGFLRRCSLRKRPPKIRTPLHIVPPLALRHIIPITRLLSIQRTLKIARLSLGRILYSILTAL